MDTSGVLVVVGGMDGGGRESWRPRVRMKKGRELQRRSVEGKRRAVNISCAVGRVVVC